MRRGGQAGARNRFDGLKAGMLDKQASWSRLQRWQPALLILFVVSLGLWWWLPLFGMAGSVFDEAMLLVAPELVLQGKVPHRDFGIYNGPGNLWTLAVVYKALGVSIISERLAGLAYRLGYLLALG